MKFSPGPSLPLHGCFLHPTSRRMANSFNKLSSLLIHAPISGAMQITSPLHAPSSQTPCLTGSSSSGKHPRPMRHPFILCTSLLLQVALTLVRPGPAVSFPMHEAHGPAKARLFQRAFSSRDKRPFLVPGFHPSSRATSSYCLFAPTILHV